MSFTIIEDKAQQAKKHEIKHQWFSVNNVNLLNMPLPVGDYILLTERVEDVLKRKEKRGIPVKKMDFLGSYKICVDTKRDIQEIIGNICGKEHERFRDEVLLAKNNGIYLYVLIENEDGIDCIDDLLLWENPRAKIQKWVTTPSGHRRKVLKYPKATSGSILAKAMKTMSEKYGVKFLFCKPEEAGEKILKILTEGGISEDAKIL